LNYLLCLKNLQYKFQVLCVGNVRHKVELNKIDASFSQNMNCTGIGMSVRDDDGTFVLAKPVSFSSICPVSVSKALGLFYALELLGDMQMDNVDFLVDSKTTNDVLHSNKHDVS